MHEPISKKELELVEKRGGQVELMAKIISIPALEAITQLILQVKIDQAESYQEGQTEKLAKFDELIKVIQEASSGSDAELKQMLAQIMREHSVVLREHATLIADFNAHKEHCKTHEEEEENERCAYKLTGKRDRRGFIDIEYGLTFTPVENDE